MVKAVQELLEDGKTGKVWIDADGGSFAELFAAWRRHSAKVDALYEQCEAKGRPPEMANHLDSEIRTHHALEAAMWAVEIATLDELKMLAELDATYTDSEHVRTGELGRAVLRILGRHEEAATRSALFSAPAVPRRPLDRVLTHAGSRSD